MQLQTTAKPIGTFRQHIKWLGDSHCGRAVALPASGWATGVTQSYAQIRSYESVHTSHSSAQSEYQHCA